MSAKKPTEHERKQAARYSAHIEQAREQYTNDDIEIDYIPLLSVAEEGVWVNAWVWVSNAEVEA